MSPEQLGQLYELMQATKETWKPVDEDQVVDSEGSAKK